MAFRVRWSLLAYAVVVANLTWAAGCGNDDDDCANCCKCSNDGSPLVYRPMSVGDCSMTCAEQCQALADREFMGQAFDSAEEIDCPDD